MITLGITDGHTATACLMRDGLLLGMVSEERLNRKKGWAGVPRESVKWLLKEFGVAGEQVDRVAISSLVQPIFDLHVADASPLRRAIRMAARLLPKELVTSDFALEKYVQRYAPKRDLSGVDDLLRELKIDPAKKRIVEHHTTHAATAYYFSPYFDPAANTLVFTIDGSGDGICASVSIGHNYRLQRVHKISSYHSVGDFYMRLTQYMGMKPLEHEYKVMGLAPYAPAEWAQKAYDVMGKFYSLTPDGLSFVNHTGRWSLDLVPYIEKKMRGHRFDCIAAAAQRLVEEIVVGFVKAWIRKTGIAKIACAGGVFMNVKTNMLISHLPEVESCFFMPSGGDESTAAGAAVQVYVDEELAGGRTPDLEALGTLYLGPEYGDDAALEALEKNRESVNWKRNDAVADEAADLLVKNQILGRMSGRMEWGARSLGNRTIIANPSDLRNVRNINRAIKMRDFWMPFCPSILEERRNDYAVNPKDLPARYMINAFESTPLAFKELVCGLHPFDLTCRPQFVSERENAGFYKILRAFERKTGIGGVLNTSFNLHGEPIVGNPQDAISTLRRSEIDYLILSNFLVWRKDKPAPEQLISNG